MYFITSRRKNESSVFISNEINTTICVKSGKTASDICAMLSDAMQKT